MAPSSVEVKNIFFVILAEVSNYIEMNGGGLPCRSVWGSWLKPCGFSVPDLDDDVDPETGERAQG